MEMTEIREESTILESTTSEDSPVGDSQPNGSAERAFETFGEQNPVAMRALEQMHGGAKRSSSRIRMNDRTCRSERALEREGVSSRDCGVH